MHAGHLRSAIIGDTMARMLEYSKGRNHVGDWGTQFGMIIEYLFEEFPDSDSAAEVSIGDLQGESFYKPYIDNMIEELNSKGMVEESVIFIKDFKIPLMLAARNAGWLPENDKTYPRASHVTFGVVTREDGKRFRNRDGEIIPLTDLLDEAKTRSKAALVERGKVKEWTLEKLDQTAEAVGYGAVKYADLKNNRPTPYVFSYDKMLDDKVLEFAEKDRRALRLHLLRFAEVNGSAEETSRLLLCEATAIVMMKCFHLLGITPVNEI
ncbi:unnamed protein product [Arabis nemorensis]|uniref:arginine--tRNA ligase n=1 Tax=Arabis nemorensis TaxID=586526 RepID=A0A565BAI9_9BRAS|nr:unnamed protein product [Arabis nemorensis]